MNSQEICALEGGGVVTLANATKWHEDTRWDGSNHISCATGSQWEHETLYCNPHGTYVIERDSQHQSTPTTYRKVETEEAAVWLVRNGHDIPNSMLVALPDDFLQGGASP